MVIVTKKKAVAAEDIDRWKLIGSLFEEELECLEIFLVGDKCVKGLAICGLR